MKKNEREIGLVHYLSQSNKGPSILYAQPSDAAPAFCCCLLISYSAAKHHESSLAWLCGFCRKCSTVSFNVQEQDASAAVENPEIWLIWTPCSSVFGYLFFPVVCIYSASLSPSSLNWGEKKACLFGVYRIKEEVNIISITFEIG